MALNVKSIHTVGVLMLLAHIYSVSNTNFEKSFNNNQENNIITDVIKNISRVKKVLHELIKNYNEVQTSYSNSGIFENYKRANDAVFFKNNFKRFRSFDDTTNIHNHRQFSTTKMILSDVENATRDSGDNYAETNEALFNNVNNRFVQHSSSSSEFTASDGDSHYAVKKTVQLYMTPDKITLKAIKNRFDGKEVLSSASKKKKQPVLKSNVSYNTTKKPATRNVKKIIYLESFSEDGIWDQIANKTPINLLQEMKSTPNYLEHVFSSHEDQDSEIFKANVLRQAYGYACMKMVIKKCYKACKTANKIVCSMFKCRSDFKEKFLASSRTGCLQEFNGTPEEKKDKNSSVKVTPEETKDTNSNVESDEIVSSILRSQSSGKIKMIDSTKAFPEEACYSWMKPLISDKAYKQDFRPNMRVRILRDKYERACQKASTQKCRNACLFAFKKTCETYDCQKGRKKAYRKHCSKQCKLSYQFKKDSKKDSSASSSDASSSDSVSDSDSY
ncbi:hypothetical protein ACJJTC_011443 [Scirpophaga incertulas]